MTDQAHGPEVPVIARTRLQQINRAVSASVTAFGFVWMALQTALPSLHLLLPGVKWLPQVVAAVGVVAQAWQKAKDTGSVQPVNLSHPTAPVPRPGYGEDTPVAAPTTPAQPPRRDLRLEIPAPVDYGEVSALPATEPLSPVMGHGEIVAGQIIDEDLPKE